jgi:phosphoglycerate dehydrogenase-like enzyme
MLTEEEEAEFFGLALQEIAPLRWGGLTPQVIRPGGAWSDIRGTRVLVAAWSLQNLPLDVLAGCGGSLEYLCLMVGSPKRSITKEHLQKGLLLTNWGDKVAFTVAEAALMMALAASRGLCRYQAELRQGQWPSVHSPTRTLWGKQVGIHGFGSVARALIQLLKPFQVQVTVFAQDVPEELIRQSGAMVAPRLEDLMKTATVLFEAEALKDTTRDSLDYRMLSLLPKEAVFVNVARGGLVVEEDLLQAALERNLHVALDVYRQEPLPMDSPIRRIPGAILLPHMAGPTQDIRSECGHLAIDNVATYLRGKQPRFVISEAQFDFIT